MMKCSSCQDHTVEQRDGDAHRHVWPQAEAAAGGSVQIDGLRYPRVPSGGCVWLPVDGECDVADEAFVQDGVDGRAVVGAALCEPPESGPLTGSILGGHVGSGPRCRDQCNRKVTVPAGLSLARMSVLGGGRYGMRRHRLGGL